MVNLNICHCKLSKLGQVGEAVNISQSSHISLGPGPRGGAYKLNNIYMPLLPTRKQSNGKQSKSHDMMRSRSQTDDAFRAGRGGCRY